MHPDATIDGTLPVLTENASAMLFHIAREALTNARKHSSATAIRVTLQGFGDLLSLQIEDDGSGFDTERPRAEEQRGLRNMRARAASMGGDLNIKSAPGAGSTIAITLPIKEGQER
jgi:signal transduction histidine kinase